ncbi:PQQ-binding-like beta-propeller repeat protein [Paludibaculum fermentans]|uniref:outer membrane protein assembly factor BamB family protein n=1 Tax=Paludibaculum fermentans TaxID=1473598 RepID=UPI003EBD8A46
MKTQQNYRNEITGAGMNRRSMLKTLLGGAGAGLMATQFTASAQSRLTPAAKKPVPQRVSVTPPQQLWQQEIVQINEKVLQQAAYGNGYFVMMDDDNNVLITDIQAGSDQNSANHIGESLGTMTAWRDGAFVAQGANGAMVVCQNGSSTFGPLCQFYSPSPAPETALSEYYSVGNDDYLLYLGVDGVLYAVDPVWNPASNNYDANVLWYKDLKFGPPSSAASLALDGANRVVVAAGENLALVEISRTAGNLVYSVTGQGVSSAVCLDGNCAYVAGGNGLDAYNIATGATLWPKGGFLAPGTLGTPISYGGVVYVGDSTNLLHAVDAASGVSLGAAKFDSAMNTGIPHISDGILYICSAAGVINACDLSKGINDATSPATFPTGIAGDALVGFESGICVAFYLGPIGTGAGTYLGAINMADLVHGYSSESELMAENYVSSTNSDGYQPDSASYRTIIQLLDGSGNPRANVSIKVWASDDVSISDGVNTYSLNPPDIAWLKTDAAGQLNIVSTASDITTPALYFWGPFMLNQEAIVVYPDHEALARLSNIQAGDLDQSVAKDYAGKPIVPDGVDHVAVANTIQNTMGGGAAAAMMATRLKNRQRAEADLRVRSQSGKLGVGQASAIQADNTYLSFPDTTVNMLYQQVAGVTDRTIVKGSAQSFTTTIDSDGNVTFGPPQTASVAAVNGVGSALGGGWSEFKSWLKQNVTDKIVSIACKVADEISHEITTLASGTFSFVVDTVEKAVAVVTGFIRTVVGDIVRAAEWLSKLFDWGGIVKLQKSIVNQVNIGVQGLSAWIAAQGTDFGAVGAFLDSKINALSVAQASVLSKLGGSLKGNQVNNNDPQTVYGVNGAKSRAQSSSLSSKVSNNIGQATSTSSTGAVTADNPTLASALSNLITQGGSLLETVLDQLLTSIKAFFDGFKLLFSDPAGFIETEVSVLVNLFFDLAKGLLTAIKLVVGFVLQTLSAVMNDILSLVNESIHIPVISDLWSLISHGEPLTLLNVFALVVAIPSHIIISAANITPPTSVSAKPAGTLKMSADGAAWMAVAGATASFFSGGIDGFCDLENVSSNSFSAKLDIAGSLVEMALSLPSTIATNNDPTYLYYAMGAFPILLASLQAGTVNAAKDATSVAGKFSNFFAPLGYSLYGVGMIVLSICLAVDNPTEWDGPGHILLVSNLFNGLDYVPKGLLANPAQSFPGGNKVLTGGATDEIRLGVALTDWIFPTASGISNAVYALG